MEKRGKILKVGLIVFLMITTTLFFREMTQTNAEETIATEETQYDPTVAAELADPFGYGNIIETAEAASQFETNLTTGDGLNGATTKEEYLSKYSTLNEQQNAAWNTKYNFRPETNVRTVGNWNDFRLAFEDNSVSKIILSANIYYGTTIRLNRTESLELDGNNFTLEMTYGSLNFDNLNSLSNFTANFSDVPVFHMHDISVINNGAYGEREINLSNAWSFINGNGEWGNGGSANSKRGLWRYRIGNVTTPYDSSNYNNNQRVGGRLIGANRGQISIWGYNIIVTGAENFYTGGIDYEPYTYHRGVIADYNYSTIWFIDNTGNNNDPDSTGSRKFEIGEGSFVYLNNTYTGTGYPGVYEMFDEINVGPNATYNVNVPGTAVSFNFANAKFIAQSGAKVNLLSRASGVPTLALGASNRTNSGSINNPANVSIDFQDNNQVFIVGNNSENISTRKGGVIGPFNGSRYSANATFTISNPESFDFRNTSSSNRGVLGHFNSYPYQFTIVGSDISLWALNTDINGSPTYDYPNVESFTATIGGSDSTGTSTNSGLQSTFVRSGYKRISGMNSIPLVEWDYVTDADLSQQAKVLLGYTATGGSDPFDENGDPRTTPVYADASRMAQIDFTDTLTNTYLGYSANDNYVTWTPENHTLPGLQIAGQTMIGTPSKVDNSSGTPVAYKTGAATPTTVLDVTPPEPIQLTSGKITNIDESLSATGLEANASVYIQLNNGTIDPAGTVLADGTWTYALANTLAVGTSVRIYLEDTSTLPADFDQTGLTATRQATGNRNPITATTYRDVTFPAATVYVVDEAVVDEATVTKSFTTASGLTDVAPGEILNYQVEVTNDETDGSGILWSDVSLIDVLDSGLDFDKATANLQVNGVAIDVDTYTYDAGTRTLTVPLGDILPVTSTEANKQVITFSTQVNRTALGATISNQATASGNDAAGAVFSQDSNIVETGTIQDNTITVNFVDSIGTPLHEPVTITGALNAVIDLTTTETVTDAIQVVIDKNYQLVLPPPSEQITISGQGDVATYTFDGILTLDTAPTVIDFGVHDVLFGTEVKDPTWREDDLVVWDNRSTKTTWYLHARLSKVLTSDVDSTKELPRAIYYYQSDGSGKDEPLTTGDTVIASGNMGATETTYNISNEWQGGESSGFKLDVPAGLVRELGEYHAEIIWTLSNTP